MGDSNNCNPQITVFVYYRAPTKGNRFNIVSSFEPSGGYFLISCIGYASCRPELSGNAWWYLSVTGLLSEKSPAERQLLRSATSLTGELWSLDPQLLWLPSSSSSSSSSSSYTTYTPPSSTSIHIHSRQFPVTFASSCCPEPLGPVDGWPGMLGGGRGLNNGNSIYLLPREAGSLFRGNLTVPMNTGSWDTHRRSISARTTGTKRADRKNNIKMCVFSPSNILHRCYYMWLPCNYHIIWLFRENMETLHRSTPLSARYKDTEHFLNTAQPAPSTRKDTQWERVLRSSRSGGLTQWAVCVLDSEPRCPLMVVPRWLESITSQTPTDVPWWPLINHTLAHYPADDSRVSRRGHLLTVTL